MSLEELLKIRKPSEYTTHELKVLREWTERELESPRLTVAEREEVEEWKALLDAEEAERRQELDSMAADAKLRGLDRL